MASNQKHPPGPPMTLGNMASIPHPLRLLGVGFLFLAGIAGTPAHPENTQGSINTTKELFAALRKCWVPFPIARSHDGMEITVRFSITREGKVFGKAAIRYESGGASEEQRLAYRLSVAEAIERCTPFPITEGFGNAIAGHPLNIKFTDRRRQKAADVDQPITADAPDELKRTTAAAELDGKQWR
jgi:hypothetical protein